MAPTSPRQRVWTSFLPPVGNCRCKSTSAVVRVSTGSACEAGWNPQKIPRAALASSDIISGDHGGRRTISASTESPGHGGQEPLHLVLDHRTDGHPMVVSVYVMSMSPSCDLHVVDQAEVDDVDAELGVDDVLQRLADLLGRRATSTCPGGRAAVRRVLGRGARRRGGLRGVLSAMGYARVVRP